MKRAMGLVGGKLEANLRPSLMAKSSAVRMDAVGGNFQAVAVDVLGIYIAAPTDGGWGRREPSVYMWMCSL